MITYPLALPSRVVTRLHDVGPGHRRPAVLVHGLGARADRWRHNLDTLAALGLRAVAIDLPGHGFATKGADAPHTVPAMRDVVVEVLDHLAGAGADEPAVLVGTSLGGNVCAAVAAALPERVSHLVMVGSLGLEPLGLERRAGLKARAGDVSRAGVEQKLHNLVADRRLVTEAWIEEEYRINNSPGAREFFGQIGCYFEERLDDHVVGQELRRITGDVQTALVWGARDTAVPLEIGERARDRLGLSLTVLEGSAHAPYLEEPERFNAFLTDFLAP